MLHGPAVSVGRVIGLSGPRDVRPQGTCMRRRLVLGTLLGVGVLSMVVSGQAPAGPSAKALSATKIEKVKDNLYIITGSGAADQEAFSGGNTAVFVTETGVTLVDNKLAGWGPTMMERV